MGKGKRGRAQIKEGSHDSIVYFPPLFSDILQMLPLGGNALQPDYGSFPCCLVEKLFLKVYPLFRG